MMDVRDDADGHCGSYDPFALLYSRHLKASRFRGDVRTLVTQTL